MVATGHSFHRKKYRSFIIFTERNLKFATNNMNAWPTPEKSVSGSACRPLNCGAKCSPCSFQPVTHGLRSRILQTSAHRRITRALYTAQIFARKLHSTPQRMKQPCAILDQSTSFVTPTKQVLIAHSWKKPSLQQCACWIMLLT